MSTAKGNVTDMKTDADPLFSIKILQF